jgi:hypothetical protein
VAADGDRWPHTLRRGFITAALDAGVSLPGVREAASHAAPAPSERARGSLDRHATCIVAAHAAGADARIRRKCVPRPMAGLMTL